MHIPDGFLSTPVWAAMNVASLPAVGILAKRAQHRIEENRVPMLGVLGAFVFAAQMINFPVAAGTSGHLIGGTLLACTLGPAPAGIVLTAILAIQALIFQDGGVLALGANVMNMAVFGVAAGYLPYAFWGGTRWRTFSIFLGGVLSVFVSASLALLELRLSGVPLTGSILVMSLAIFLLNGVLEGAITVAVMRAIHTIQPGWIRRPQVSSARLWKFLALMALALVTVGILAASVLPDGLESLAEQLHISSKTVVASPMPDYEMPIWQSPWLRRASAGLTGLFVVYMVCLAAARAMVRQRNA